MDEPRWVNTRLNLAVSQSSSKRARSVNRLIIRGKFKIELVVLNLLFMRNNDLRLKLKKTQYIKTM